MLSTLEPPPARSYIFDRILPFELEVLRARCAYWAGEPLGYWDDVGVLMGRCRRRAREGEKGKGGQGGQGGQGEKAMWMERGARMALVAASQLVEMKVRLQLLSIYLSTLRCFILSAFLPQPPFLMHTDTNI